MLLPPTAETAAAFFNAASGAILLSMPVLYGDDGIKHRVTDSQAKVLVTNEANKDRVDLSLVEHVLILDDELLQSGDPSFDVSTPRPTTPRSSITRRAPPASRRASSTRTSRPASARGVRHAPLRRAGRRALPRHGEWAWRLIAPPGPWRYGAVQLVLQRKAGFDSHKQLDFLSRHEATNVFTTPTAMRSMMSIEKAGEKYPQKFRVVCSAGEPLNPEAIRWFREQYGVTVPTTTAYGVLSARRQLPVHGRPRGLDVAGCRAGTCRSSTRTRSRCRRASAARSARARGRTRTILGYWNNEEASKETFGGDWFHTKDAASLDEDGYVWPRAAPTT